MSAAAYDNIIVGAGLYGLYAARLLADNGQSSLVIERDRTAMGRATWINQARVHNGYHYPRSISTAAKSAHYYRRFHEDHDFCILSDFRQIYATSAQFSWTDSSQFASFCSAAGIPCREIGISEFFRDGMVDGAFLTEEDTYDAAILREHYMKAMEDRSSRITLSFGSEIHEIDTDGSIFEVSYTDSRGSRLNARAQRLINATYASANQLISLVNAGLEKAGKPALPLFTIKYELCEIILCRPSALLKDVGITVMDGPFFSIMPFGKTGFHSLTAVTHTPHAACMKDLPAFNCQNGTACTPLSLQNCNDCANRPETAWTYMKHLADKYLLPEYSYEYSSSLFSMKPILRTTEVDDARPTAIRRDSIGNAELVSVLSGKINTVYDLDEVLN